MARAVLILLIGAFAAGGAFAGHYWFVEAVDGMAVGGFPRLIRLSSEARQYARGSFALACAVLGSAVVVGAWVGARFSLRKPFPRALFFTASAAFLSFTAAAFFYREYMSSFWSMAGEFTEFARDRRFFVLWNPLTQIALLGASGALVGGLIHGSLLGAAPPPSRKRTSPGKKKKRSRKR